MAVKFGRTWGRPGFDSRLVAFFKRAGRLVCLKTEIKIKR